MEFLSAHSFPLHEILTTAQSPRSRHPQSRELAAESDRTLHTSAELVLEPGSSQVPCYAELAAHNRNFDIMSSVDLTAETIRLQWQQ